jgi:hypothetical protein
LFWASWSVPDVCFSKNPNYKVDGFDDGTTQQVFINTFDSTVPPYAGAWSGFINKFNLFPPPTFPPQFSF